jgi:hypothetical protein
LSRIHDALQKRDGMNLPCSLKGTIAAIGRSELTAKIGIA